MNASINYFELIALRVPLIPRKRRLFLLLQIRCGQYKIFMARFAYKSFISRKQQRRASV